MMTSMLMPLIINSINAIINITAIVMITIIIHVDTDKLIFNSIIGTTVSIIINFNKSKGYCTSSIVLLIQLLDIGTGLHKRFHRQPISVFG